MAKIITRYHHKDMPIMPVEGEFSAKNFSDAEIHKRAKADPDAQPLTDEELAKFRRVNPFAKK